MLKMKEPSPGSHISIACKDAVALAQRMGKPVQFTFNGIPVTASPEDTAASTERRWHKDQRDRAKAYYDSPAGKLAAQAAKRDQQRQQKKPQR